MEWKKTGVLYKNLAWRFWCETQPSHPTPSATKIFLFGVILKGHPDFGRRGPEVGKV